MDVSKYSFKDFIAYVMIYAAEADFEISEAERKHIIDKVGKSEFEKMLQLFESHNDIQCIDFILALEDRYVPKGEEDDLISIVKGVVFVDEVHSTLEENTLIALERLAKHR